jgi:hypothetical protein
MTRSLAWRQLRTKACERRGITSCLGLLRRMRWRGPRPEVGLLPPDEGFDEGDRCAIGDARVGRLMPCVGPEPVFALSACGPAQSHSSGSGDMDDPMSCPGRLHPPEAVPRLWPFLGPCPFIVGLSNGGCCGGGRCGGDCCDGLARFAAVLMDVNFRLDLCRDHEPLEKIDHLIIKFFVKAEDSFIDQK